MEQTVCVLKFGGTSVGSGERIRRVAAIIADTVEQSTSLFPVVVVSAMSGVTDQLLRIARYACSQQKNEYTRNWSCCNRSIWKRWRRLPVKKRSGASYSMH